MSQQSPDESHVNRLSKETSPYLLQHQHNPVDWYPWGPEAFERARREDRPIFLSVGYSTCYWCHVMERQSFEVEAVAAVMNEKFVNIKVDREERPDVDQLYMTAVQLLTRHWLITDGTGHVEEVRGPGVVGKQPTLKPGESFEYTSGCPLGTPFGVMEGTYQMVTQAGERFDARIAPFTLSEPYTVH